MTRCCIIFLLSIFTLNARGQDLSGHWIGELPQDNKQLITLKLAVDINQNGTTINGKSVCTSSDGHWVIEVFSGSVTSSKVVMNEYKAEGCNCTEIWRWCLKKMEGSLTVDPVKKLYTIQGMWHSDTSYDGKSYSPADCSPGRFVISKSIPAQVIVKKSVAPAPQSHPYIPKNLKSPEFDGPLDGYYVKSNIKASLPVSYAKLREADVVFANRIWREIDLRERMNQYLLSPKGRLIDLLMNAIAGGQLLAYDAAPNAAKGDPNGDEFKTALTPEAAKAKLTDSTIVHQFDAKTGDEIGLKRVLNDFVPDSIVKFRIKEDWYFDKQRSVLEPHIIGIAPMIRPKAGGLSFDYQPAFWIYFPAARPILAANRAIIRHNDAEVLSFDDAFLKRIFSSYIIKQSNERDERIRDYKQGTDQLHEAEKLKKELMDWEFNLWQYE